MNEKVQRKGKDHHPSLFNHGLFKLIFLHQLLAINISWETFMETVASTPTTSPPIIHNTPSSPTQQKEVGSSSRQAEIQKEPRVEINQTYEKGKRMVFAPKIIKGVCVLDTTTE